MNQREQRQWQATLAGKIAATERAEKAEARVAELEAQLEACHKRINQDSHEYLELERTQDAERKAYRLEIQNLMKYAPADYND